MIDLALVPSRTALLIVDVQERLAAVMPEEALARTERNIGILAELARRLDIPVVLSEQYPRGLGPTTQPVLDALAPLGDATHRLDKIDFSVCDAPAFADVEARVARPDWIVCGMEAHICVYQTVRRMVAEGANVHVPADAVVSRLADNRTIGIDLMRTAGAIITSTETIVFDALGRAGTDDFKAMSKLVR